jgi:hypothetical protein
MKRTNKDVLNGFIKQAVSYNKYLEENEMWKMKRDEEHAARREEKARRSRSPSKKRSPSPSSSSNEEEFAAKTKKTERSKEEIDDLKAILALYKDAKEKPSEKWDHSGFMELYPHQNQANPSTSNIKKVKIESSNESETSSNSSSSPERRKKKKDKKKKKKKSHKKKKKKEKKKKE